MHIAQIACNYSDPGVEDVLYEIASLRQFCCFELDRIPDERAILRFRYLLEQHDLAQQIFVTVNRQLAARNLSACDVDIETGLMHTIKLTSSNAVDISEIANLLCDEEMVIWGMSATKACRSVRRCRWKLLFQSKPSLLHRVLANLSN